jgi:hypothetical protein
VEGGEGAGDVRRDLVWRLRWRILRGGQGGSAGFFDDGWRRAGVRAFGEFGSREEFGVAGGAVARTQEVEEALLADGDVGWGSNRRSFDSALRAPLRMTPLSS